MTKILVFSHACSPGEDTKTVFNASSVSTIRLSVQFRPFRGVTPDTIADERSADSRRSKHPRVSVRALAASPFPALDTLLARLAGSRLPNPRPCLSSRLHGFLGCPRWPDQPARNGTVELFPSPCETGKLFTSRSSLLPRGVGRRSRRDEAPQLELRGRDLGRLEEGLIGRALVLPRHLVEEQRVA